MIGPLLGWVISASSLNVSFESGSGLMIAQGGIPIVRGSGLQYFSTDRQTGYFSSSYHPQRITKDGDAYSVAFSADDPRIAASETVRVEGNRICLDYLIEWKGDGEAVAEVTFGNLWAPAFANGSIVSGAGRAPLMVKSAPKDDDSDARKFLPDAADFRLESSLGSLGLKSSVPSTLFDMRTYKWAPGRDLMWYGVLGAEVSRSHPVSLHCEMSFDLSPRRPAAVIALSPKVQPAEAALVPDSSRPILIPKPKSCRLDYERAIPLPSLAGLSKGEAAWVRDPIQRRFKVKLEESGTPRIGFVSRRATEIKPGGYRLVVGSGGIEIAASDQEGRRMGLCRLAQIAFNHGGRVCLPSGEIEDEPGIGWRGVHLFVGPQALEFQSKLLDRVLAPLGFNKVVLQCERTAWQSLPGIETGITMPKADLASLFKRFRSAGLEPIPLIQSFGHAEWLFANNRNLDLAFNPQVPYALDPRKPRSREVLSHLWKEAIDALHPQTVHFGLDEVDMRGFPKDPSLVTKLWKEQIPFLASIAERSQVKMMLWGDKGLGPGEAIDAAFGDSAEEARARRSVIPSGALVADWHYAGNPDIEKFRKSLQLWKKSGQTPIASTWFNPQNIRAFTNAANLEGCGTLLTTWAGYESSEDAMLRALKQFSAMVLAADYAWNPRTTSVDQLGYNPLSVLKSMYFDAPSDLRERRGDLMRASAADTSIRVGRTQFLRWQTPLRSFCAISQREDAGAESLRISTKRKCAKVYLLLDADRSIPDGTEAGTVTVTTTKGIQFKKTLTYGLDLRAADDSEVCVRADRGQGLTSVGLDLPAGSVIAKIEISNVNPILGLTLCGITMVN